MSGTNDFSLRNGQQEVSELRVRLDQVVRQPSVYVTARSEKKDIVNGRSGKLQQA